MFNKTLVALAVQSAYDAGIFDKVIVTSDYPRHHLEIDDLKRPAMTRIEFINRPSCLCTDDSPMLETVYHALKNTSGEYHWVWLLQPTSPIRFKKDFETIKSELATGRYESALSCKPVKEHPNRMMSVKDGVCHPNSYFNFDNKQDLKEFAIRSGNYYVTRPINLLKYNANHEKCGSFYVKPCFTYMVDRMHGTNIDDNEDLVLLKNHIMKGNIVL